MKSLELNTIGSFIYPYLEVIPLFIPPHPLLHFLLFLFFFFHPLPLTFFLFALNPTSSKVILKKFADRDDARSKLNRYSHIAINDACCGKGKALLFGLAYKPVQITGSEWRYKAIHERYTIRSFLLELLLKSNY